MATMTDTIKKYYTKEGYEALKTRCNTLVEFYNEDKGYPLKFKMLGFGDMEYISKEDLRFAILELTRILFGRASYKKIDNGSEVIENLGVELFDTNVIWGGENDN